MKSREIINGVFCPYEGTLIVNGRFYEELFEHLKDLSLIKEVFILADEDGESIKLFLEEKNVDWKVVPIENYSCSKLEILFSGYGPCAFFEKYKISAKSYNRISFQE